MKNDFVGDWAKDFYEEYRSVLYWIGRIGGKEEDSDARQYEIVATITKHLAGMIDAFASMHTEAITKK